MLAANIGTLSRTCSPWALCDLPIIFVPGDNLLFVDTDKAAQKGQGSEGHEDPRLGHSRQKSMAVMGLLFSWPIQLALLTPPSANLHLLSCSMKEATFKVAVGSLGKGHGEGRPDQRRRAEVAQGREGRGS